MYFYVTLSAIYNWKGSGTAKEQKNPNLLDSFCHLIIAQEVTTESIWMLLVDQGDDSGIPTTNCIEYIVPRICEQFTLEISKLRAFEVWPQHKDDSKLKYTEIVISEARPVRPVRPNISGCRKKRWMIWCWGTDLKKAVLLMQGITPIC